jgi:hypothetical protein
METFTSSVGTQFQGGRRKIVCKGKGKLKEKMTKPPSFYAFVEVPLNQIMQTLNDVKKKKLVPHMFFPPFF